jgi:hypothetical protein
MWEGAVLRRPPGREGEVDRGVAGRGEQGDELGVPVGAVAPLELRRKTPQCGWVGG